MYPKLLELCVIKVYSYGVLVAAALLMVLAYRSARSLGMMPRRHAS